MNVDFAMKIKKTQKFPKMHDTLLSLITGKKFMHRWLTVVLNYQEPSYYIEEKQAFQSWRRLKAFVME
jgi:hypothetical protein